MIEQKNKNILETKSIKKAFFVNSIFTLSVFCYFVIIPIGNSETQPYGFIFAFINLILFSSTLNKEVIFFLIVLLLLMLISIVFNSVYETNISIYSTSTSVLIFSIPVIIFCALYDNISLIKTSTFNFCLYSWFTLGVFQEFFPKILEISGIENLLQFFIPRFSSSSLSQSNGRGITLFATEPSGASFTIILFLFFTIYLNINGFITKKRHIFNIIIVGLLILWNHSTTLYMLLLIWGMIYVLLTAKIKTAILFIFSLLSFYFILNLEFLSHIRGVSMTLELIDFFFDSENLNGEKIFDFFNASGSMREVSIIVGYGVIPNNHILGLGLGSWQTEFINEMVSQGYRPEENPFFQMTMYQNIKPAAYIPALLFDTGIVGIVALLPLLFRVYSDVKQYIPFNKLGFSILIFSILAIFFHTIVSLPIFWITCAIGIDIIKFKKN